MTRLNCWMFLCAWLLCGPMACAKALEPVRLLVSCQPVNAPPDYHRPGRAQELTWDPATQTTTVDTAAQVGGFDHKLDTPAAARPNGCGRG